MMVMVSSCDCEGDAFVDTLVVDAIVVRVVVVVGIVAVGIVVVVDIVVVGNVIAVVVVVVFAAAVGAMVPGPASHDRSSQVHSSCSGGHLRQLPSVFVASCNTLQSGCQRRRLLGSRGRISPWSGHHIRASAQKCN